MISSRAAGPAAGSCWRLGRALLPAAAALAGATLLIGVLAWPMLLTSSGFGGDWLTHLWYMWHQSLDIRSSHAPSLFLSDDETAYYPIYAFYGGTLYALAGTLSLLLGDAPLKTYVITYIVDVAAAYGGWYWMSRAAGLGRWWGQLPGVVFVTSPYYLTLIYARGDWPEFTAVSMIPLLLAAAISNLRAERLRLGPALALAISGVVFFGAHNITILWGSTVLAVTGAALLLCVPRVRSQLTVSGVLRVARLLIPAALISAWFILPSLAYESRTSIGSLYPQWRSQVPEVAILVSARHLFTLTRPSVLGPGTDFVLALPVVAMAWVLLSLGVASRSKGGRTWRRILVVLSGMTVVVMVVMTHAQLVLALPRLYTFIQFTYRLESYVLLGLSGAILASLVLARGGSARLRLWSWTIAPVLLVSIVAAIQQVDAYPKNTNPGIATSTSAEPIYHRTDGTEDYADVRLPKLREILPARLKVLPTDIHGDRASVEVHAQPGELVGTNIASGPELLHVGGARMVGVDARGHVVLAVDPAKAGSPKATAASAPAVRISLSRASSTPIVLGRMLTLVGLLALAVQLAILGWAAARPSGRSPGVRRRPWQSLGGGM